MILKAISLARIGELVRLILVGPCLLTGTLDAHPESVSATLGRLEPEVVRLRTADHRVADREGLALPLTFLSVVAALEVHGRIVDPDGGLELRDQEWVAGLGLRRSKTATHQLKALA